MHRNTGVFLSTVQMELLRHRFATVHQHPTKPNTQIVEMSPPVAFIQECAKLAGLPPIKGEYAVSVADGQILAPPDEP